MTTHQELKSIGLKATLPRQRILAAFQSGRLRHMSAEDVQQALLSEDISVGLGTVYRVLLQFEQAGLLRRANIDSGRAFFELEEGESLDELRARMQAMKPKKPTFTADMLDTANSYDDKVALIRMLVSQESGRVALVLKNMVRS